MNFKQRMLRDKFLYEFPRMNRILMESADLIQSTNNLDTLTGRTVEMINCVKWMITQKKNGMPINIESKKEEFSVSSVNQFVNVNVFRIVEKQHADFIDACNKLKSEKAINNRRIKFLSFLNEAKSALKEHTNKVEYQKKIEKIISD